MSPSIDTLRPTRSVVRERPASHIVKKRKLGGATDEWSASISEPSLEPEDDYEALPSSGVSLHSLGIKPSGNVYEARVNIKDRCGSFAKLPDELLLELLEYLESKDLLRLGGTCKALYAFAASEDLWKTLFIESPPKTFSWRGTWRSTHISLPCGIQNRISCAGLFSDALYLPFHRAHVPLLPFTQNIPRRNQITRLPDLTPDDFNTNWASKPFILTSPVKTWPVYSEWSMENLLEEYHDTSFRAEAVDWPFRDYVEYMRNTSDESPLYLFDCRFAEKMHLRVGGDLLDSATNVTTDPSYHPPHCFSPDLFTALGSHRPDHRWLIIGPSRSGSTFHADPNATSAWNAVLRGSEYWLLFPPSSLPIPGLHISPDSSHITAPLSIAEYLVTFHAEARRHPGAVEAVCAAGEVLHVPSGWFHLVLNLEDGVALTQNFVPEAHLADVLSFMRDKREQVSGFRRGGGGGGDGTGGPEGVSLHGVVEGREYEVFVDKLREQYPQLLDKALAELEGRDAKKSKKTKWEELTGKASDTVGGRTAEIVKSEVGEGGFSFGFGFDAAEEEDEEDEGLEEVEDVM